MTKPLPATLLLSSLLAACGGKSNGNNSVVPPPPSTAQVQGKWSGVATSHSGGQISGDFDLQQTGSSIFSTANNTFINGPCATNSDSLSGQVTGNSVAIILLEGGQH